jgi:antitoxin (DNA-binding transcriptional repressor) of toxin-antitoxin stability system
MTTPTMTIEKSELEAQMLEGFRELEESGQELIVTDNGKPVLKIVPIVPMKRKGKGTVDEIFGHLYGKAIIHEDINTPTIDEWGDI